MKKVFICVLFLLTAVSLFPITFPKLQGRVNDYAGILDPSQEQVIESMLENLENRTTAQVVLLTIRSLEGETIEDYSIRLTEQKDWKIGQKEKDNGVILVISMSEKKLRLEVGYGLEGVLTDLKSGYIIRKIIVPRFKKGDYYEGILQGLTTVSDLISKKSDIPEKDLERFKEKDGESSGFPFILFLFIFFFFILPAISGKKGGGGTFWGGGFGGGSSGGGFGGFSGGGGSFGGGGSSGGW